MSITPGPWHYDGSRIIEYGTKVIATVPREDAESRDNARAIAAVPEMVKFLRAALP